MKKISIVILLVATLNLISQENNNTKLVGKLYAANIYLVFTSINSIYNNFECNSNEVKEVIENIEKINHIISDSFSELDTEEASKIELKLIKDIKSIYKIAESTSKNLKIYIKSKKEKDKTLFLDDQKLLLKEINKLVLTNKLNSEHK